jgi:hypothetical protein
MARACGGIATVMSTSATAESYFSVAKFVKKPQKNFLSNLSLQGLTVVRDLGVVARLDGCHIHFRIFIVVIRLRFQDAFM